MRLTQVLLSRQNFSDIAWRFETATPQTREEHKYKLVLHKNDNFKKRIKQLIFQSNMKDIMILIISCQEQKIFCMNIMPNKQIPLLVVIHY